MFQERSEIRSKIPADELLAGLAEEASELAQAALKLRRAYTQVNPTPITEEEGYDRLLEEIADVEIYLGLLPLNKVVIEDLKEHKIERWLVRLKGAKNERKASPESGK